MAREGAPSSKQWRQNATARGDEAKQALFGGSVDDALGVLSGALRKGLDALTKEQEEMMNRHSTASTRPSPKRIVIHSTGK